MPGAVIALDQDRPGPTVSAGSPGISRNDLWVGHAMHPQCTTSGNASFSWTLLDKPRGSSTMVTNDTQSVCTLTPDLPGSYRLQLVTNSGGPGNIQILTFRVRFDSSGNLMNRGLVLPALGESPGESNYPVPGGNNTRGYDDAIRGFLEDALPFLVALPFPVEIVLSSGAVTTDATSVIAGSRKIDLSKYPASISGKTRAVHFAATLAASDLAAVGEVVLYDITHSIAIVNTTLDNSGAASATIPEEFTSTALIVGNAGGQLWSSVASQYEVRLQRTAGALIDTVTCYNARLIISYV